VLARQVPDLSDEIAGLARGAAISQEEALLLQLRRELLGYTKIAVRGDCTTFARTNADECLLAQTVDLNGGLADDSYVLHVRDGGRDGRSTLVLTFPGLLGYLGINSHGVAVGLNLVLGGQWGPGVPPYLAIRHLLDEACCAEDAVGILARLDLASSRALTIADERTALCVEILEGAQRWTRGETVVHANHFLTAEWAKHDALHVFARNGSIERLRACERGLARIPQGADDPTYLSLLSSEPLCVPPDGDLRHEATVARVVLRPRERRIAVQRGAAPDAPITRLTIEKELRANL
jgi:hypothetical protein